MNSPNMNTMSENVPSPIAEAENQQVDELKMWNKSSIDKRTSSQLCSNSPKLDSASTSASPSHRSFMRQNSIFNRKKLKLDEEEYESLEMACNSLASEMPDDCDAFGKHVAAQLRIMTKMQKFMAQRLISEICFRGQIQHLSLSTNVVNNVPQQQSQSQPPQQTQPQPTQTHLQPALFVNRPPLIPATMFGRSPDYMLLHQQGLRPSNAMPSFQNFINAQNDHSSVPLE